MYSKGYHDKGTLDAGGPHHFQDSVADVHGGANLEVGPCARHPGRSARQKDAPQSSVASRRSPTDRMARYYRRPGRIGYQEFAERAVDVELLLQVRFELPHA